MQNFFEKYKKVVIFVPENNQKRLEKESETNIINLKNRNNYEEEIRVRRVRLCV